jgi:hypothetical protein
MENHILEELKKFSSKNKYKKKEVKNTSYKDIKKKFENNIEIIYNNLKIEEEIEKIYKKHPNLHNLAYEISSNNNYQPVIFYFSEDKNDFIEIEPKLKNNKDILEIAKYQIILSNFYGEKCALSDPMEFIEKELDKKNNNSIFDKICKKTKINPNIWKDILIAKFLGFPKKNIFHIIDEIIKKYYLPKTKIIKNRLYLEINELTTIDDIKYVWKSIKKDQKNFEKINGFINQKRKYQNLARDKEIIKLIKKGLTSKEIMKKVNKNNKKIIGYEYISKVKTNYNKKFIER